MNVKIREIGEELVPELKRLQSTLMMAGGAGLVVCAIGFVMNPAQFVRSFLPAYMWMLSITLGSLALAMVHQVSGDDCAQHHHDANNYEHLAAKPLWLACSTFTW